LLPVLINRIRQASNKYLCAITQVLHEPVYNVLRTKEQLGYSVACHATYTHGVLGFNFAVSSDKDPVHVESRIDAFLSTGAALLSGLSESEFKEHMHSLIALKMEAPKNVNEVVDRHWAAAYVAEYGFLTRYQVRTSPLSQGHGVDCSQLQR
jgi:insulysin